MKYQYNNLIGRAVPLSLLILFLAALPSCVIAQVSGKVYNDFNATATQTSALAEPGVAGVIVKATKPDGITLSDTTDASGAYSFTVAQIPSGTAVRIEFINLPTGAYDGVFSATAGSSGTTTQFVTAGAAVTNVNLGLSIPAMYCQVNPMMAVPCYVSGDPLAGGTSGSRDWFVSFDYNSFGNSTPLANAAMTGFRAANYDVVNQHLNGTTIGSLWGVAYHRASKQLYSSAFVKRHVGLGVLGEGGIYRFDYSATTPTVTGWLDVTTIGMTVGQVGVGATPALRNINRGLNSAADAQSTGPDADAYEKVGRVGLGDIDISDDESTLWVVNLFDKTINAILIDSDNNPSTAPTASDLTTFSVPNPCGSSGVHRPFALKFYQGELYVGVVCETSLEAFVYRFDGTNFHSVLVNGAASIPLSYSRGMVTATGNCRTASGTASTAAGYDNGWFTWTGATPPSFCSQPPTSNYLYTHPEAVLADIEFDIDGSMILGFMDRSGHLYGAENTHINTAIGGLESVHSGGDILRVCKIGGQYFMQGSAAGCNNNASNNSGPNGGEFYHQDYLNCFLFCPNPAGETGLHTETFVGGLSLVPGTGEVAAVSYDPFNMVEVTGGVNWFNNTTGVARNGYMLYLGQNQLFGSGTFGKANGLGDIEALCDLPTIEIGNRVWNDINRNGIQDPGEPVLVGVTVSLYDSLGVLVPGSTLVTNANGQFIFSSNSGTSTANFKYGLSIKPNTKYQVIIDALGTNASVSGLLLTNVTPLTPGEVSAENSGSTINNNDATLVSGKPTIVLRTGVLGENNHSFDIGMACVQPAITAVTYTPATCLTTTITPQNNATLKITTDGDKAAISTTGTPTTAYASATAVTGGMVTFTAINGTADSLFVRIFEGANCYFDTLIVVNPVICCPTITWSAPALNTAYCSGVTIPALTVATTARNPDSIRFVYFTSKQIDTTTILTGGTLFGTSSITGVAASNNVTLANAQLPMLFGSTTDTLWVYAIYRNTSGNTFCKIFAERTILLKPEPVANISGFTTACNSTAITLTSYPATTYKWGRVSPASSTLGTAQTLTITPASNTTTTYWLITTNAGACPSDTVFHSVTTGNGIQGTVYRDFDSDGIKDAAETNGVAAVKVYAYSCAGVVLDSAITDAFGRYYLPNITAANGIVRIEFSNSTLGSYLQESFAGTGNGTDVQFVTAPQCNINFAVKTTDDYCQTNPAVIVPCYDEGLATGSSAALVSIGYNFVGTKTSLATFGQVGATWGTAYQRSTKTIFNSAYLKRHVGFAEGPGHIFMSNSATGFIGSFDLQGVNGIDLGSVDRSSGPDYILSTGAPSIDLDAFTKVGKVSFGDIDLYDQRHLFAVNLNSRSLIKVDVSNPSLLPTDGTAAPASLVQEYPLTFPTTCSGGIMRPSALKIHNGIGYLGAVCDASISNNASDLGAYVFTFDPENPGAGLTQVLQFSLNYPREPAGYFGTAGAYPGEWKPWKDVWATLGERHVSPAFGDIEFTEDGSMVIGLLDRVGDQVGANAPIPVAGTTTLVDKFATGDILKACFVNGSFIMEGTSGACPVADGNLNTSFFLRNGTSPNFDGYSGNGEFFFNEFYRRSDTGHGHGELALSGLAILPGSSEVLSVMYDPLDFGQQGLARMSTTTGARTGQVVLVGNPGPLNKANGLGDAELACDPAPIQIGNYVWLDADQDGVQDPCELPAVGVKVFLYTKDGMVKDSTVTNATGNYYFSSPADSIQINTVYYILLGGTSQFNTTTGALTIGANQYELTVANTGEGINADQNDSDGSTAFTGLPTSVQGYPIIMDSTGGPGYVNHKLDFGLITYVPCITPVGVSLTEVSATCNGAIPNNDGTLTLTAATNATRFGISTINASMYDGPGYTSATTIALPQVVANNIPNTGGTFILRLFNTTNNCYLDTMLTVNPVICTPPCILPSGITISQMAPTCTGPTANNNGSITLVSAADADKWGISTLNAGTYNGNSYAAAAAYAANTVVKSNIPNAGGTYILRLFNGANGCYTDQIITVSAVSCSGICNCKQMVYLNDTELELTHKFEILADGSFLEVDGDTSTPGIQAWYVNPPGGKFHDPHGLGTDLNGNIYIGQTAGGNINKFSCDGDLLVEDFIMDGGFNYQSDGNYLYVNHYDDAIYPRLM